MKLYSLLIFRHSHPSGKDPYLLAAAYDLSSFGFFQRNPAREFITFLSRTCGERCEPGTRVQVEKDQYVLYVHSMASGLVACVATDSEYPARVAFGLCSEAMRLYTEDVGTAWSAADAVPVDAPNAAATGPGAAWPKCEGLLKTYGDPVQADKILTIRRDLDEVKTQMHAVIGQMLERGQQLDDLVEKSGDLSASSQNFYRAAKKTNSCCSLGA
eukprot:TRINITY_DN57268_c0_g1_i1.p1 TRINITY_DN57268_c0_g1~~TRINITY_DN57268_c0_g1_i1.p1  ORF type:complete len:214 (+),score=15.65 TRINITY_DN57268_c0_g1_i1:115-756(+)